MAVIAKTLLSAVTVVGAGTAVDLTALARSLTVQIIATDVGCVIELDGSLDNVNWFSMGQAIGPGPFSIDQDVIQYIRANVVKLASGSVTAYCASVSG